jgi:dynein heavy chain
VEISESLVEAEEVEVTINFTRNSYRDVSIRGSILYFVIADLAGIDSMYQNSLDYVKMLFNQSIRNSEASDHLPTRITMLMECITKTLYINICRGLFEHHKMIFSFIICTSILRNADQIDEICWNYLLRGAGIFDSSEQPPMPKNLKHVLSEP